MNQKAPFVSPEPLQSNIQPKIKKKKNGTTLIFDKIIKICVCLLVFAVPLFFSPLTLEPLEFNKQSLIILLIIAALLAWLGKIFSQKKLELAKTFLNFAVFGVLLAYGLSALFSSDRYLSFIGAYDRLNTSFLSLFCFALFYFLIIDHVRQIRQIKNLLIAFLVSGTLVTILGFLQIFGYYIFPWGAIQNRSFNTIGTLNILSIFLALNISLAVSLLLNPRFFSKKDSPVDLAGSKEISCKIFLGLLVFLMMAFMTLVNFWAAWVVLIIGMILLITFANIKIKILSNINLLTIPTLILVFAILFSFIRIPLNLNLPAEVIPSQKASWQIGRDVLTENVKNFFFGSGPETFAYDYARYHSAGVNETDFWETKFNKSGSEFLTLLPTIGLAGMISWGGLILAFLIFGIYYFAKEKNEENWFLGAGLFSAWLMLLVSKLFYPANITLDFLGWLMLGLFVSLSFRKVRNIDFRSSPRLIFILNFIFILSGTILVCFLYLGGQRYLAETSYKKAQDLSRAGAELDAIIPYLNKAVRLNGFQDNYYRNLAQAILLKAGREISAKQDEETFKKAQLYIDQAVKAAKKSVELGPANAANWSALGNIYQNIVTMVPGSEQWAVDSYQKALELEPSNPVYETDIGVVYLAKSERSAVSQKADEEKKNIEQAKQHLLKSIELKMDYAPAHFQMALIHIKENNIKDAISEMELSRSYNPSDASLIFQLGLLYYQQGEQDKAEREFKGAVSLVPTYSNARWYLAMIYEKEGKISDAIAQLEEVVKLNPENETAKNKLESLKNSLSTPPAPTEPATEENKTTEENAENKTE